MRLPRGVRLDILADAELTLTQLNALHLAPQRRTLCDVETSPPQLAIPGDPDKSQFTVAQAKGERTNWDLRPEVVCSQDTAHAHTHEM